MADEWRTGGVIRWGEPADDGWDEIGEDDGRWVAGRARAALVAEMTGREMERPSREVPAALLRKLAMFVTVEAPRGEVRGCIGTLEPDGLIPLVAERLARELVESRVARRRFPPLLEEHVPVLEVEVSLLSAPLRMEVAGPEELVARLRPGIDGGILELVATGRRSVLLPRVWARIRSGERFLASLCAKQDEDADAWRRRFEEFRLWTFETRCFRA